MQTVFSLFLVTLFAGSAVTQQLKPPGLDDLNSGLVLKIKGHIIGETIEEYLSKTPNGMQYLEICRASDTIKKARKAGVDYTECQKLISAVVGYSPTYQTWIDSDTSLANRGFSLLKASGTAEFSSNKLVKLRLLIRDFYEAVRGDVIAQIGKPESEDLLQTQNRMGAMFNHHSAVWKCAGGSIVAELFESDDSITDPVASLTVESSDAYQATKDALKNRKSSIE